MSTEQIDELIALKIADGISEEEDLILQQWLGESEENLRHFNEEKKIWQAGELDSTFEPNVDAAWNKVSEQLHLNEKGRVGKVVKMPNRTNQILYRIAASIIILLGVTWIYTNEFSKPEMVRFATLANEQKELILPDNSVVYLNSNSAVEYPEDFKGDTREIKLEGEAFFEVKRNPMKPFIIHTSDAYTKVLGTSFNVLARKNSKAIIVSVKTGKVEVGIDAQHNVQLDPGYSAIVNLDRKEVQKTTTPSENYLSWKTKEVVFNDVTISEVIAFMESYYDVNVNANEQILNCHFTGKFNDPSLTELLNVLELSNGIQYQLNDKEITFKGNPCIN